MCMELFNQKFMNEAVKSPLKDQLIMLQNAYLLSKAFFHFPNISNRQFCVPWPFLILSKYYQKKLLITCKKSFPKSSEPQVLIGL